MNLRALVLTLEALGVWLLAVVLLGAAVERGLVAIGVTQ